MGAVCAACPGVLTEVQGQVPGTASFLQESLEPLGYSACIGAGQALSRPHVSAPYGWAWEGVAIVCPRTASASGWAVGAPCGCFAAPTPLAWAHGPSVWEKSGYLGGAFFVGLGVSVEKRKLLLDLPKATSWGCGHPGRRLYESSGAGGRLEAGCP